MLITGKNNDRFLKNKVAEKFYLAHTCTNNFHYYNHAKNKYGGLVRLAMTLLFALAVLVLMIVLYGDLALHIDSEQQQP
jgi:hypothetical protein